MDDPVTEVEETGSNTEVGHFMAAMRRLQDVVVSTDPDNELWGSAARPCCMTGNSG